MKSDFISATFDLLKTVATSLDVQNHYREILVNLSRVITANPLDETTENVSLQTILVDLLLDKAEATYGPRDTSFQIYPNPMFIRHQRSQVYPLKDDHTTFCMTIGDFAQTWDQFFYEMCPETVHLLNPVLDIEAQDVSALEEGVAVKFAEHLYAGYMAPWTKHGPKFSPLHAPRSSYNDAYRATKKIPDTALSKVREKFGKLSNIHNVNAFHDIVGAFVSESEARMLSARFPYERT